MRIPNKFNGYSSDGIRLYNDPVTVALVGAGVGAALKPKNPLQGALLGAAAGFTGGAALGAAGVGAAAGGTGLAAGTAGSTGLGLSGGLGATTGAGIGLTAAPAATGYGLSAAGSGLGLTAAPAATGYGLSAAAAPATFGATLANLPSAISQNPMLAKTGLDTAQGLMSQEPMMQAPQGQVSKGQPRQAVDFMSLLNPQQNMQRPQPISLL